MGRRKALRRITALRNKVASAFIARMTHEAELKEIYRVKQLMKHNATLIAAVWRGFSKRLANWRKKETMRIRNEAATTLQVRNEHPPCPPDPRPPLISSLSRSASTAKCSM